MKKYLLIVIFLPSVCYPELSFDFRKLDNGNYALSVQSESNEDFSAATKKWHDKAKSVCGEKYSIFSINEYKGGRGSALRLNKKTGERSTQYLPPGVFGAFRCDESS